MIVLLLLILCCVFGFRTVWLKLKAFDEALHQALHAAFVRFSLDSE